MGYTTMAPNSTQPVSYTTMAPTPTPMSYTTMPPTSTQPVSYTTIAPTPTPVSYTTMAPTSTPVSYTTQATNSSTGHEIELLSASFASASDQSESEEGGDTESKCSWNSKFQVSCLRLNLLILKKIFSIPEEPDGKRHRNLAKLSRDFNYAAQGKKE
jgi:hypothetical protein